MGEGLVELDRELTVLSLNRSAERMIERERHELIGQHLFDALPAARGSELARKLDEARGGESSMLAFTATLELARDPQRYDVRIYPGVHPDAISIFFARGSTDAQGQEAG
jgi:PAS domain-containing protein